MPPLPLNDAHCGGFFHYTSAGVLFTRQKSPPRLGGFLVETELKQTKKTHYNGTKIGVLLLTQRKSKT